MEEAEATLSNSKNKELWFFWIIVISTYLRLRLNIQTQATPLVTGIEQWYYIINVGPFAISASLH